MSQLSNNDQFVLSCLFPEEKFNEFEKDSSHVTLTHLKNCVSYRDDQGNLSNTQQTEIDIIKSFESGLITSKEALKRIDAFIKNFNLASAYNNRAQIKRLLYLESQGTPSETPINLDSIETDLDHAIHLAKKDIQKSNVFLVKFARHVMAQAYTQKGWVVLKRAEEMPTTQQTIEVDHKNYMFDNNSNWKLEEEASKLLHLGGEYGNKDAQRAAALVNPYAKLCGQMVECALHHEYKY